MPSRFIFSLFLFLIFQQSFAQEDLYNRKKITDKNHRYEFYVTDKSAHAKSKVTYYWFKGGLIHQSEGAYSGDLLHGDFEKFYLSNQLAEKGQFKKGKKVGTWKTWHENGVLASSQEWAGGQKNGNFFQYDVDGKLIETGLYRANRKNGKWINYIRKDTLKYNRDKLVVKKKKSENNPTEKKTEKAKSTKSNVKSDSTKKESFFKRLFTSKKKTNKNAKGK